MDVHQFIRTWRTGNTLFLNGRVYFLDDRNDGLEEEIERWIAHDAGERALIERERKEDAARREAQLRDAPKRLADWPPSEFEEYLARVEENKAWARSCGWDEPEVNAAEVASIRGSR